MNKGGETGVNPFLLPLLDVPPRITWSNYLESELDLIRATAAKKTKKKRFPTQDGPHDHIVILFGVKRTRLWKISTPILQPFDR